MTQPPENAELAACPFCGGRALTHRVPTGWRVTCVNCDVTPRTGLPPATEAEAITAWNQRTPEALVERIIEGEAPDGGPYVFSYAQAQSMVRAALSAPAPPCSVDGMVMVPTDQPGDGAEDVVERLLAAISHGDDEHRAWLGEAVRAFFAGDPIPEVRGSGRKEARIAELEAALTSTAVVPGMVMVPLRAVEHLLWAKDRRPETLAFADEAWQEIRVAVPTQARAEGIAND